MDAGYQEAGYYSIQLLQVSVLSLKGTLVHRFVGRVVLC